MQHILSVAHMDDLFEFKQWIEPLLNIALKKG